MNLGCPDGNWAEQRARKKNCGRKPMVMVPDLYISERGGLLMFFMCPLRHPTGKSFTHSYNFICLCAWCGCSQFPFQLHIYVSVATWCWERSLVLLPAQNVPHTTHKAWHTGISRYRKRAQATSRKCCAHTTHETESSQVCDMCICECS